MSSKKLLSLPLVGGFAFGACVASADTITLKTTDGYGETSWNAGSHWSDGKAPSSGNDYVVPADKQLRTPADVTSCPAFAGDSLTINGNLALKSGHNTWIEAKKWILGAGGCINAAQGHAAFNVGTWDKTMTILGTSDSPSRFRVSGNNNDSAPLRTIWVRSKLVGESGSKVVVCRSDDSPDETMNFEARVKFTADNTAYKGAFALSRIPVDTSKSTGREWCYVIDFGQDAVPGGTQGVVKTMGAGVDSGNWLTMGDKTTLHARGMPFTARYPLALEGDARINVFVNNDAHLSGRRGNESIWFGNAATITGSGSSVIDFRSPDGLSVAVALGDVTMTGVQKITVSDPVITLRVYPGYNNPGVTIETCSIIADEADGLGPVVLKNGGHISPGYGTQGVGTLGLSALTMEAGSYLYYSAAPATDGGTTNDFVRISGNLVNATGGKITIGFDALCTSLKPGDKLALLSAANLGEAGVTASDFELDNTCRVTEDSIDNSQLAGTFSIEEIGGAKKLVFTQTSRQVVALVGKDSKGASCFDKASSGNAHWGNNAKPSADYDYMLPNETLLRVNSGSYTFAGHSLSVLRGACFGLDLTYSTVGDLRLYGGSKVDARDQTQYNQTQSLKAGITVYATRENPVTIENTGYENNYPRYLEFREGSTLKGEGDIRFQVAAGYVAQAPNSTTFVKWDASDFTGGIVLTGRACRVNFKDEKAMGGRAPAFRADRLRIEGNARIECKGAYTMSDPTRGITIGGGVTSESEAMGATFDVGSGPLVISNQIFGTTMLRKLGSATLSLCCPSNAFSGQVAHKEGKLRIGHRDALAKATKLQCYESADPVMNPIWFIDAPEGMTVSSKDAFCRGGNFPDARFRINLTAFDNRAGASTVTLPIFRVKGAKLEDAAAIEDWITLLNVPTTWKPEYLATVSGDELVIAVKATKPGFAVILR